MPAIAPASTTNPVDPLALPGKAPVIAPRGKGVFAEIMRQWTTNQASTPLPPVAEAPSEEHDEQPEKATDNAAPAEAAVPMLLLMSAIQAPPPQPAAEAPKVTAAESDAAFGTLEGIEQRYPLTQLFQSNAPVEKVGEVSPPITELLPAPPNASDTPHSASSPVQALLQEPDLAETEAPAEPANPTDSFLSKSVAVGTHTDSARTDEAASDGSGNGSAPAPVHAAHTPPSTDPQQLAAKEELVIAAPAKDESQAAVGLASQDEPGHAVTPQPTPEPEPPPTIAAAPPFQVSSAGLSETPRAVPLAAIPHVVMRLASDPERKTHSIRIRLDPPRLGQVSLDLHVGEKGLTLRIVSQTPETRDLLEHDLPRLQELLKEGGFDLQQFSASCDSSGRKADWDSSENSPPERKTSNAGTVEPVSPPSAFAQRRIATSVRINACA